MNYIEGYARKRSATQLNFYKISYGSLQESKYLLDFSRKEAFISAEDFKEGKELSDEVGAMLWTEIKNLEQSVARN